MVAIAAIGEVMLELAPAGRDFAEARLLRLGCAGDTFNTAVYLARLGVETHYVTLLGDDSYSGEILQQLALEQIDTHLIEQLPGRRPGIYMIENSPSGERQFSYWRSEAPARELFNSASNTAAIVRGLTPKHAVYLSGVTLAIISETARLHLLTALIDLRARGVKIVFDSNYRPRLWRSLAEAQSAMMSIMEQVDIALMTSEDEEMLWGDGSIEAAISRYQSARALELVIKRGAESVLIYSAGELTTVPVPTIEKVTDTTGAGDSFNAGYLAARLGGATALMAARQGIKCAGIVIQHSGAITPKADFLARMTAQE